MNGTKNDITGRDDWIISKALAIAIVTIERLPRERQPLSDKADMEKLLHHLRADADVDLLLVMARATIERRGLSVDAHGQLGIADREIDGNVTRL